MYAVINHCCPYYCLAYCSSTTLGFDLIMSFKKMRPFWNYKSQFSGVNIDSAMSLTPLSHNSVVIDASESWPSVANETATVGHDSGLPTTSQNFFHFKIHQLSSGNNTNHCRLSGVNDSVELWMSGVNDNTESWISGSLTIWNVYVAANSSALVKKMSCVYQWPWGRCLMKKSEFKNPVKL